MYRFKLKLSPTQQVESGEGLASLKDAKNSYYIGKVGNINSLPSETILRQVFDKKTYPELVKMFNSLSESEKAQIHIEERCTDIINSSNNSVVIIGEGKVYSEQPNFHWGDNEPTKPYSFNIKFVL